MQPKPILPGPGQESVGDYPRPPRIESVSKHIEVDFDGIRLADSTATVRALETSHPPIYYIPPDDVAMQYLTVTERASFCEWKGSARYYAVRVTDRLAENAAWCFPYPTPAFAMLRDYIAFYPALMDACRVDGELAQPQAGNFYGGWITSDIVGPFKGAPGSSRW